MKFNHRRIIFGSFEFCHLVFWRIFSTFAIEFSHNMAKVYVFLADGFEEVEALAPIDILRRGSVEVISVSIMGRLEVNAAHGVTVRADKTFEDIDTFDDADLVILPGGMPGAANLDMHDGVRRVLLRQSKAGKRIAAICAAPFVLGKLGILDGRRATCYPGFEQYLDHAEYTAELVTVDGNVTTGEGPAAAFPFGYELLRQLTDSQTSEQVAEGMRYLHLMNG